MTPTNALDYYGRIYGENYWVAFSVARFTYAGHLLAVDILSDTNGEGAELIHIRQVAFVDTETEILPAVFAEAEASSLITERFTGKGGDIETLRTEIRATVAGLVASGEFGEVN